MAFNVGLMLGITRFQAEHRVVARSLVLLRSFGLSKAPSSKHKLLIVIAVAVVVIVVVVAVVVVAVVARRTQITLINRVSSSRKCGLYVEGRRSLSKSKRRSPEA